MVSVAVLLFSYLSSVPLGLAWSGGEGAAYELGADLSV